jgi:hypothetical protein
MATLNDDPLNNLIFHEPFSQRDAKEKGFDNNLYLELDTCHYPMHRATESPSSRLWGAILQELSAVNVFLRHPATATATATATAMATATTMAMEMAKAAETTTTAVETTEMMTLRQRRALTAMSNGCGGGSGKSDNVGNGSGGGNTTMTITTTEVMKTRILGAATTSQVVI